MLRTLLSRADAGVAPTSPSPSPPMQPRDEQTRVAEAVLQSAARLLDDRDPTALVQGFCADLLAAAPRLRLAWTWFGDPHTAQIVPQIVVGPAQAYARALVIDRNLLTRIGPAFRTLDGRALEPFNISTHSLYKPWRAAAREHGLRSTLAVPLRPRQGDQRGLFVLYADAPGYFDAVGVGLFAALGDLIAGVLAQAQTSAQLALAARSDPLTGLSNRAHLESLEPTLLRQRAEDPPLSLLILDLDHFKRINDAHGHAAGDAVICGAAQRLREQLRKRDGVARWGGEEFVVWLPHTDLHEALGVAEKLREGMAALPFDLGGGQRATVTASIGAASLAVGETLATGLGRADAALYASKLDGRNRVSAG